jgi:integrase
MATLKFYLSRYIKKDDERGEIQMRFSGNRNFVKRMATGIFITAGNWDAEKGMPKGKKNNKYRDDCEGIRERLNELTSYLLRCWEQLGNSEPEPDMLAKWMNDIEWIEQEEEVVINGNQLVQTRWTLETKSHKAAMEAAKKRELKKLENRYFLSAFEEYIEEQYNNGVIGDVRKKTYMTGYGLWDRMEKYQGKRYKLNEIKTEDIYTFRNFIINECDLWRKDSNGQYKPKSRFESIYEGYEYVRQRGVEKRSLNYVINQIKYVKAFWHWLLRVKRARLEDIFLTYTMDQAVYGTPFFFSNEDRTKLFEADFSKRPELAVQRDIFVFQSLVGCRVGDLLRMTKSNVVDGKCLQYVAGKTKNHSGRVVTVPLHPTAKIILERYKDTEGDKLLPFISNQNYNDAIKEMFKAVEDIDHTVTILDPVTRLEKQVKLSEVASSHMGRRNFCGNLYDAGFRDADIASMSGHAEGSKAISRYRKVSEQQKQKMIDSL